MIWFGGALKDIYKGSQMAKYSSHIDITPTILRQMDIHVDDDYFGVDIFAEGAGFVPYCFMRGYGMIKQNDNLAYSITYEKFIENNFQDSSIIYESEMFLQHAFDKYLSY